MLVHTTLQPETDGCIFAGSWKFYISAASQSTATVAVTCDLCEKALKEINYSTADQLFLSTAEGQRPSN